MGFSRLFEQEKRIILGCGQHFLAPTELRDKTFCGAETPISTITDMKGGTPSVSVTVDWHLTLALFQAATEKCYTATVMWKTAPEKSSMTTAKFQTATVKCPATTVKS